MKQPSRIHLLACLCATVALLPGVASALTQGCRLVDGVGIGSPHQYLICAAWSLDGNGVAVSGKADSEKASDIETRVEKFVHRTYMHGVPYSKSKELGTEALPILERMLADTSETKWGENIVMAMGFIGDSSSVKPLVDFLENRFEGDVRVSQFGALLEVTTALGFIAGNGNASALEYLTTACYVKTWMAKGLKWHFRHYSGESLAVLLAKVGASGLSFSGTDRAKTILLNLQEHPESEKSAVALKSNIEEGLTRIDRIQKEGAVRVFGAQ